MVSNTIKLYSFIFKLLLKLYYLFILVIGIKKKKNDEYKYENKLNHYC